MSKLSTTFRSVSYGPCSRTGGKDGEKDRLMGKSQTNQYKMA